MLLQYRDDLLFAEPASFHSVRLLRVGLYSKSVTFQGSTSKAVRTAQTVRARNLAIRPLKMRENFDRYVDGFDDGKYSDMGPWWGWFGNSLQGLPRHDQPRLLGPSAIGAATAGDQS
jgi:hypothetical protein